MATASECGMRFRSVKRYKVFTLWILFGNSIVLPPPAQAVASPVAHHHGFDESIPGYPEPRSRGEMGLLHLQAGPASRLGPLAGSAGSLHSAQDPGHDAALAHRGAWGSMHHGCSSSRLTPLAQLSPLCQYSAGEDGHLTPWHMVRRTIPLRSIHRRVC